MLLKASQSVAPSYFLQPANHQPHFNEHASEIQPISNILPYEEASPTELTHSCQCLNSTLPNTPIEDQQSSLLERLCLTSILLPFLSE